MGSSTGDGYEMTGTMHHLTVWRTALLATERSPTRRRGLSPRAECPCSAPLQLRRGALQCENGHAPGSWHAQAHFGGAPEVGGLHAYAAHRFRLIGFEQSIDNAATPGAGRVDVADLQDAPLYEGSFTMRRGRRRTRSGGRATRNDAGTQASWRLTYRRLADAGPRGVPPAARWRRRSTASPNPPAPAKAIGYHMTATRLGGALLSRRRLKMGCPPQWEAYGRDCFLASAVKLSATEHKRLGPVRRRLRRSRSSRTRASWGWRRGCARSRSRAAGDGLLARRGSDHTCRLEKKVGFEGDVAPRRSRRGCH